MRKTFRGRRPRAEVLGQGASGAGALPPAASPWRLAVALLVLCPVGAAAATQPARVVGFPKPHGKSHYLNTIAVLRELEHRGHATGIVTPVADAEFMTKHAGNLTLGTVKEDSQYSAEELEEILAKAEDMTLWESIIFAMSLLSRREICPIKSLHETAAKLKELEPQLLLLDGSHPCGFIIADLLQVPRVAIYTFQPLLHILEQQHGVYATTAMWPAVQAEYDPYRPTLAGRLRSAVVNLAMGAVILAMDMDGLFRRAGLNSTLGASASRSRLAIVASDPFLDLPVHLPPYVHHVGAITPGPGGRLADELDTLLRSSNGRSVFVSFGTSGVGNKTAGILTTAWEKMPGVTIIWKVPDVGSLSLQAARRLPNVHLVDWVDQNAILSHKSLGAFLTHGGHNSVSEAAYHGVPTVAVAIFADQSDSAARLVHHGSGIKLNKKLLDADKLQASVADLLDDPSYRQAARRLSLGLHSYRARETPVQRIANLIQDELQALANGMTTWPAPLPPMRFWQKQQVDVYLLLTALGFAAAAACVVMLRACCACCCRTGGVVSSKSKAKTN